MAVSLQVLQQLLDTILCPDDFDDYCPNGLQVEGGDQIKLLVTGVTASQTLLDTAIDNGADAILVHHGYFWRGERPEITGIKKKRIATLMTNDVSLLAYHLPLDAHPVYGNNARLADVLGITTTGSLQAEGRQSVGNIGCLSPAMNAQEFVRHVSSRIGRKVLHIPGGPETVKNIAWCTGAAQGYIDRAVEMGVDVYISGEISESTVHIAREEGIHYIAAGHHATERYGVKALGELLAAELEIEHLFIDIDCPV
jgi:dinuclear metal center YbgI/SA1388 family protein